MYKLICIALIAISVAHEVLSSNDPVIRLVYGETDDSIELWSDRFGYYEYIGTKNDSPYYVLTQTTYAIWKDDLGNWCVGPYSLIESASWHCALYSASEDICSSEWYITNSAGVWEKANDGVTIDCLSERCDFYSEITGGGSCCKSSNLCLENEGDCDRDSDCKSDLLCGAAHGFDDNCDGDMGFPDTHDCCYDPDKLIQFWYDETDDFYDNYSFQITLTTGRYGYYYETGTKNDSPYYVKYGPDEYHSVSDYTYAIWKDDNGYWCQGFYRAIDSASCHFSGGMFSASSDICSSQWYLKNFAGAWENANGGIVVNC